MRDPVLDLFLAESLDYTFDIERVNLILLLKTHGKNHGILKAQYYSNQSSLQLLFDLDMQYHSLI